MKKEINKYVYQVKILRVVDGDTFIAEADLGFNINIKITTRILDLDTPEIRGVERPEGIKHKEAAIELFDEAEEIIVHSNKKGKYGRWLVDVYLDGKDYKKLLEKRVKKNIGKGK